MAEMSIESLIATRVKAVVKTAIKEGVDNAQEHATRIVNTSMTELRKNMKEVQRRVFVASAVVGGALTLVAASLIFVGIAILM